MRKKRRAYPPKHRALLAQKARENKPWEASTGPRTDAGKAAVSQNAITSGLHTAEIRNLRNALSRQAKILRDLRVLRV